MSTMQRRTPWQVTRSVWYAMFMREAVSRTMADRMGWFWMLFEPIAMVLFMIFFRTVIMGRVRFITNADFIPWLVVGLLAFFMFRDNMLRLMGAVEANRALFGYRQVKPIDPVLVRSAVETTLRSFIFLIFIAVGVLLNWDMLPDQPLQAIGVWCSLWMLGLGMGLTFSVLANLVPEIQKLVKMTSLPLLFLSGVIMPINMLPHFLHEYMLYNPILHGLEMLRLAFFERYHTLPGVSLMYLWYWALASIALGLMLHIRFQMRLKSS